MLFSKIRRMLFLNLLFFATVPVFASVTINEKYTTYDVSGNSVSDLHASMKQNGPISKGTHYDAVTTWDVDTRYQWKSDGMYCRITNATVVVDIVHHMPNWINENTASAELQNKWNTFIKNLDTHEQGHANNGKQAGSDIERALLSTSFLGSCDLVSNQANVVIQIQIKAHNDWDDKYDADTEHGKTQGAILS